MKISFDSFSTWALTFGVAFLVTADVFGQSAPVTSLENQFGSSPDTAYVNQLIKKGMKIYRSSPDQAEEIGKEIIDISKKINYPRGLVRGNHLRGLANQMQSNYLLANDYYKNALTTAASNGDKKLIATILNSLGMNFTDEGKYTEALEHHLKSLQLVEELNDMGNIPVRQNNIGVVYLKQNDITSALTYFRKAKANWSSNGNERLLGNILTNMGICYKNIEKYDSAVWFHEQALALHKKMGDKRDESSSYYNLALTYKWLKQYNKALDYLDMNFVIKEELEDKRGLANCMQARAEVYLLMKNFPMAKNCIDQAFGYLAGSETSELLDKALYERKAEYYEAIGDFRAAMQWTKRSYDLKDSLFNETKSQQLAELQTLYDLSKKEKEIVLLESENKQAKLERTILFTLTGILLLFGLLITVIWQKQRQKKKMLETEQTLVRAQLINAQMAEQDLRRELEFKNKELASYTVNFIQKSKLMEDMKTGLEQLGQSKGEDLHHKIKTMNRIIDSNFQIDKEWDDFRLQFEQIHRGFFEKLQRDYPDLTSGDLKLCALIKLNMNVKESVRVLRISPESVKMARYRLRRKLKLDKNQSLTNFVMGINNSAERNEKLNEYPNRDEMRMTA